MMIYIFGDSHSCIYHDHINDKCINQVDTHIHNDKKYIRLPSMSITMHRIGRDGLESVIKTPITDKDVLVIVMGEIDVRCHIYRQINDNHRDENEIISTLANQFISRLSEYNKKTGCKIVFRGIIPPLPNGKHPDISSGKPEDINYFYPIRGSLTDRKRWQAKLNKTIENLCDKKSLFFLPSPIEVEDNDGFLRYDRSDYEIHINNRERQPISLQLCKFIDEVVLNNIS